MSIEETIVTDTDFVLPPGKEYLGRKDVFGDHKVAKEIYEDKSRFKVFVSGRQSGKSVTLGQSAIRVAMNKPLATCWIVLPDYKNAFDVYYLDICLRLAAMGVKFRTTKMPPTIYIDCNIAGTPSKIEFKSAENEKNLKGRGLNFIGIDEFAMIKPEIFIGLLPSILKFEDAEVFIASSIRFGGIGNSLLKDLWQKGDIQSSKYQPGWKSWKFNSTINPYLSDANLRMMKSSFSKDAYQQEIESNFDESSGGVYSLFETPIHIKPLQLDPNLHLNLSFDFNVRLMTTTVSQIAKGKEEKYEYNNYEVKEQKRVLNILDCINTSGDIVTIQRQCDRIKQYLREIQWENDVYIYGDATGAHHHGSAVDGCSYWETVKNNFPNAYYYIPTVNPPVLSRFNAVNTLFRDGNSEVGIFINDTEGTKPLVEDFESIVYNKAGSDQDKSNPELTHNADNIGYLIAKEFPMRTRALEAFWI